MAKDSNSLDESRAIREFLISKWQCIPTSVWRVNWGVSVIDLSHSYAEQMKEGPHHNDPFILSGVGARHGALSRFPQDLCRFLIKFLTPEKLDDPGYFGNYLPTIIDPFAGHNSRFESVWRCNRNYLGYDISKNFMELNRQVLQMLMQENEQSLMPIEAQMEFVEGDSRNINYNEQFDFCISSPPFWDLELASYGSEPEQLGNAKIYPDFMYSLKTVAQNCYRALKPGCFLVWELNDFRKDGRFYPFHADGIAMFKSVGFMLHDIIIADYGSGFLQSFLSDIEHHKIVSKEHSYFIVVRKGDSARPKQSREDTRERLVEEVAEKGHKVVKLL